MKHALISPQEPILNQDGEAVGARVVEIADAPFPVAEPLFWVEVPDGTALNGVVWAGNGLAPSPPPPPPTLGFVESVSQAQAMIALFNAGLLATVQQAVESHPYEPVKLWFKYAGRWERSNPYLNALAIELGLTESGVDDLFLAASKL